MKYAFTTMGCPDWTVDEIISKAFDYGYSAVDIRGLYGNTNTLQLSEFTTRAQETAKKFNDANMPISCFSTTITLFNPYNRPKKPLKNRLQELRQYSELCQIFNTDYIRVFGGRIGKLDYSEAIIEAVNLLDQMGEITSEYGVKVLFETHDDWSSSAVVKQVMDKVGSKAVCVLWDIIHTALEVGETPSETWGNIGKWIEYTHVKDGYFVGDKIQVCLFGDGNVPLKQFVEVLENGGYEGYYTLEWPLLHDPRLVSAEIVYPQYINYMKTI